MLPELGSDSTGPIFWWVVAGVRAAYCRYVAKGYEVYLWVQAQASRGAGCDNSGSESICRKSVARRTLELRIWNARIIHGEASDPPARG